jgi:tRNA (mo5U34)-methyltransferase
MLNPRLPDGMTIDETQILIDSMHWHHSIDFGDGLASKSVGGLDQTKTFAAALLDGIDLNGKSLLDIGAWNGGFSFEAKRRGAARVVACDKYVWTSPIFRGRQTFDLARSLLGLEVEAVEMDIPFVTADTVGVSDVVLFSGVFYHLLEAVRLTRQISQCARHLLVLETHQDALDMSRPAMVFYPGTTLDGDATNWWGPNPQCVYELLTEFGFAEVLYRDSPGFEGNKRGMYHAFRNAESMKAMGVAGPVAPWVSLSDPDMRAAVFAPILPSGSV